MLLSTYTVREKSDVKPKCGLWNIPDAVTAHLFDARWEPVLLPSFTLHLIINLAPFAVYAAYAAYHTYIHTYILRPP